MTDNQDRQDFFEAMYMAHATNYDELSRLWVYLDGNKGAVQEFLVRKELLLDELVTKYQV